MARKIDCKVDHKSRMDAIKHLKGQGFHAAEGEQFTHVDGYTATLVTFGDTNGKTMIAYDANALENAKAA